MKIIVVYRQASEHRLAVDQFLRDYRFRTGRSIEIVDPDSQEGSHFCRLHDITTYPTILAISYDGSIYNEWQGPNLPTISEVAVLADV